jgi:hypothetical protein
MTSLSKEILVFFFLQEDPIYLQSVIIHLANGGIVERDDVIKQGASVAC